ncbi:MAG TPA: (deoxy)nucleoside triphosphate pyrophosphohydrolase [Phycisphaerales bacterium]|nr:(deoxy)nucleoside triphosphate pyrophosphohydrolase [Phycisphaerales bacterium]HMP38597.1 (deoxy)nucleoside triphosphate pyrophosphohydrolase [Phycisphaerales bacterium]
MIAAACLTRTRSERLECLVSRRRPDDSLGGKWEFPGGKIEPGESPEAAATRELFEELGVRHPGPWMRGPTVSHAYPTMAIRIQLLLAEADPDIAPQPLEVAEWAWVDVDHLGALDWPEANLSLVAWIAEVARAGVPPWVRSARDPRR